jgi:hypothetical protein
MRRRQKRRLLLTVLALAGLALILWAVWPDSPRQAGGNEKQPGDAGVDAGKGDAAHRSGRIVASGPTTRATTHPAPRKPLSQREARQAYEEGMRLCQAGKVLQGRVGLTRGCLSGKLDRVQEEQARKVLTRIADETFFSRQVTEGDPYASYYVLKPGDTLSKVEADLELKVPWEILKRINGIENTRRIWAGTRLKVIRGPFHAIVCKGDFAMDVYAHRPPLPRVFVRRLRVGLGKHGTTPEGMWRVARGKKLRKQPWHPPPSSPQSEVILWGEPGYPLGADGLWIGLEGIDAKTKGLFGYGVHGTNEPASVGKAESLGCIRLLEEDIQLLFSLLYEVRSTVEVRK